MATEENGDAEKDDDWKFGPVGRFVMPVEEGSKVKAQRQPYQPTPAEVAHHELTHIPFRDWCVHCMKGRGQSNQHRSDCKKMEGEEISNGAVTTFSIDYMFLTMEMKLLPRRKRKISRTRTKSGAQSWWAKTGRRAL